MNEYLPQVISVIAAIVSWYCYRWGHSDGREDGYAAGLKAGARALSEPPSPDLSGGPRERP